MGAIYDGGRARIGSSVKIAAPNRSRTTSAQSTRSPPDLWALYWALMTSRRREIALSVLDGLGENVAGLPLYQSYLPLISADADHIRDDGLQRCLRIHCGSPHATSDRLIV